jgi:hypothetical protein
MAIIIIKYKENFMTKAFIKEKAFRIAAKKLYLTYSQVNKDMTS